MQTRMSDTEMEEIGHWGEGSEMARVYDSAKGAFELAVKAKIRNAVASVLRPPLQGVLPPHLGLVEPVQEAAQIPLPKQCDQVTHVSRGTIHE